MIYTIVAMEKNRGIGKDNNLLIHLPGDLPRFKKLTMGNTVVMGRKTWDSLPFKPLKGRRNIVITRNRDITFDGAEVFHSVDEVVKALDNSETVFIIGGGEIYNQFLTLSDKLLITEINMNLESDTFFPEFKNDFLEESREKPDSDIDFSYVVYKRI